MGKIEKEFTVDESGVETLKDKPDETPEADKDKAVLSSEEILEQVIDEIPEEEKPETKPAEDETPAKSFKDLGREELEGKTPAEIIALLAKAERDTEYFKTQFGHQTEEVGTLRKQVADVVKPKDEPKEEPNMLDDLRPMTEAEIEDYNKIIDEERNPVKAMLKYGNASLKAMIQAELKNSLTKDNLQEVLGETLREQEDSLRWETFAASNREDSTEFRGAMETLDSDKCLGRQNRPYEELLELSKLWNPKRLDKDGGETGGVPDPLWTPTFNLMNEYNMSFIKAKEIAQLQLAKKAESPKADPADKLKRVHPKSTTKTRTQLPEKVMTADEALEAVVTEHG